MIATKLVTNKSGGMNLAAWSPSHGRSIAGWPNSPHTSEQGEVLMHGGRRSLAKEEKIEWLEEYKTDLERELQGVTERIQELKK